MEWPQAGIEEWFALRVRVGSERGVSDLLDDKGYQTLLPVYLLRRRLSRGIRRVELPLFPGYVFCLFDVGRRLPILTTPGVMHVVGSGRTPTPVDEREIASIQRVIERRLVVSPADFLAAGAKVRIIAGALSGVEGVIVEFKNSLQLILSVTLLQRAVRVEISRDLVTATAPCACDGAAILGGRRDSASIVETGNRL
ncbi:MAG TPA: transcription termination/antitermination NusG family protein [Terriglobia bacterium]|nr:transcription termination/antitermination NusG family protein [Terriglobia bacterium]